MRPLMVFSSVTVDGFMAGPDNGHLDIMVSDPQLDEELQDMLMSVADTMIIGRRPDCRDRAARAGRRRVGDRGDQFRAGRRARHRHARRGSRSVQPGVRNNGHHLRCRLHWLQRCLQRSCCAASGTATGTSRNRSRMLATMTAACNGQWLPSFEKVDVV
jgi:hypothetical protein